MTWHNKVVLKSCWNLTLTQIHQPSILFHALQDDIVPYYVAREMTAFFGNCIFHDVDTSTFSSKGNIHSESITVFTILLNLTNQNN